MNENEYNSIRVKELVEGIARIVNGTDSPDTLKSLLMVPTQFLKPHVTSHNGKEYYATGKVGNRLSDGMMGREFRTDDDSRCWLYRDLSIKDD